MCSGPFLHVGAAGPVILTLFTTRSPTSAAILASTWFWMIRNWVAQAVDSAATVSTPSRKLVGVAWSAMFDPTTAGHRPKTAPSATRDDQPLFLATSRVTLARVCGSRASGPGPDHRRRLALPATRRPGGSRRRGPLREPAGPDPCRPLRSSAQAVRRRPGCHRRDSTVDLLVMHCSDHLRRGAAVTVGEGDVHPVGHPVPGDVVEHGGGDQHLLCGGGRRGEGFAARGVEFGEHVVE